MIDPELLSILVCPETHLPLALASASQMEKVNSRTGSGQLKNRSGALVAEKIEAGLVRSDGKILYPIKGGIPVLLINEGIEI